MNVIPHPILTKQVDSMTGRVLAFARKHHGPGREREAWVDFFRRAPPPYSESPLFLDIFLTWYLYSWGPSPVAMTYIEKTRTSHGAIPRAVVEGATRAMYSFHVVQEVRPGQAVLLRDEIENTEGWAIGQRCSRTLVPGDIVFSKVIEVFGLRFLLGTASTVIPKFYLTEIRREARSGHGQGAELQRINLYYQILGEILVQEEAMPFK